MADYLEPTAMINDLESPTVIQNDKSMTNGVQTASNKMEGGQNSSYQRQSMLDGQGVSLTDYGSEKPNNHSLIQRQAAIDYLSTGILTNCVVEYTNETFSNDPASSSDMVDRNKATVEDSIENQVDREKATVEDHGHGGGMVDRRQSTVDHLTGNTGLQTDGSSVVDCRKSAVLEGTTVLQPVDNAMVDQNKETVEDEQDSSKNNVDCEGKSTSHSTFANGSKDTGKNDEMLSVPEPSPNDIVDRNQDTVEDAVSLLSRIHFNVDSASDDQIIKYLPTKGQYFQWSKSVKIGRGDDVDIFINDEEASREHVQLQGQVLPNGEVLFMMRNRSTKGYTLNRENIKDKNRWVSLNKGDQIKIARLVFVVDIIPAQTIIGQNFVLEFKTPQPSSEEVNCCVPAIKPQCSNPQASNTTSRSHAEVPFSPNEVSHACLHATPVPPHMVHPHLPPGNHMPVFAPMLFVHGCCCALGQQLGNSYPPGKLERFSQQYEGRVGYVKLSNLRLLAREAVGEWKALGRALGLLDWQITILDKNHFKDEGEKSYQMLLAWVSKDPEKATLENLKKALKDDIVERGDLAEKYCTLP